MAYVPQLLEKYRSEVVGELQKEFGYKNVMQVPRLQKITLNMGLGEAVQNGAAIDQGLEQLTVIAGQKPVVTKAKKSIANFKLREGMSVGAMVTLRFAHPAVRTMLARGPRLDPGPATSGRSSAPRRRTTGGCWPGGARTAARS